MKFQISLSAIRASTSHIADLICNAHNLNKDRKMIDLIKLRINHGNQAIPDIRKAMIHEKFRGLPEISKKACKNKCSICQSICPTEAISLKPVKIDLGRCIFCGECERTCPEQKIKYTNYHMLGSSERDRLIIDENINLENFRKLAIQKSEKFKKIFKRSLKLREVSAGGCNGCEMELSACSNVNFDMSRFGIEFTASPRHADGIVITGPITENMSYALIDTFKSTPNPKIIIAVGACAISGGLFERSEAVNRDFLNKLKADLYIPGCPVHPLTFINAVLDFLTDR